MGRPHHRHRDSRSAVRSPTAACGSPRSSADAVGRIGSSPTACASGSTFEPWSGTSINTIAGGAEVQELPLPALLACRTSPSGSRLFRWSRWRKRPARGIARGARRDFSSRGRCSTRDGRAISRGRWRKRARSTAARTGARSHLAAEDGPLFAFIEKARAKMPATPARVFMVADAPISAVAAPITYTRTTFSSTRGEYGAACRAALRPGDYLVVYQRLRHAVRADGRVCCAGTVGTRRGRSDPRGAGGRALPDPVMDSIALIAGLLLPWLARHRGAAALRIPTRTVGAGRDRMDHWRRISGGRVLPHGVDARAVLGGVQFAVLPIAAPLGLLTLLLGYLAIRRHGGASMLGAARSALRALIASTGLEGAAGSCGDCWSRGSRCASSLLGSSSSGSRCIRGMRGSSGRPRPASGTSWDIIVPFARSEAWFAAGGAV